MTANAPGPLSATAPWISLPDHRDWLRCEALRQFRFFRPSLDPRGGFHILDVDGTPVPHRQELHATTRMVHAFALGAIAGAPDCGPMIDHGMAYLAGGHHDATHGGYVWSLENGVVADGTKLAYGHVFVLLAGASAKAAGHSDADRLIAAVAGILDRHFWEPDRGLFRDELARDWTPFSTYRGMNANMHAVEALLSAHEATGQEEFLVRAGRILSFFVGTVAPAHGWRLPEHYTQDWQVDRDYGGNPMFRPAGTTPGHSFELARLLLQHWDLAGRADPDVPSIARRLAYRALHDAWNEVEGGFFYTLDFDGSPAVRARYWWPVTEAIGAVAALQKCAPDPEDEAWYRRLWSFASDRLIDQDRGGWYPEVAGAAATGQFIGKPDIYHSIQAALLPLAPGLSDPYRGLRGVLR